MIVCFFGLYSHNPTQYESNLCDSPKAKPVEKIAAASPLPEDPVSSLFKTTIEIADPPNENPFIVLSAQ